MSASNTPRDLDPKFRDAEVPEGKPEELDPREVLRRAQSGEIANDPYEGEIVHIQRLVDSAGNLIEKEHRTSRADWPAYSAKNGL